MKSTSAARWCSSGSTPSRRIGREILRINEIFRGRIVDVTPTSYTLEITGEVKQVAAFLELLQPFGIQEIVRSGTLAIARGSKSLSQAGGEQAAGGRPEAAVATD